MPLTLEPETLIKKPKTGVVLLNMGGPDSLKAVQPFLFNLFSDPDMIRLPFNAFWQNALAWWISTTRNAEAQEAYKKLGGRSPIFPLTQEQSTALKKYLSAQEQEVNTYVAMRYWHPFTREAVDQIIQDEIEHLIVLPLYPHFSNTTTGSSIKDLKQELVKRNYPVRLSTIFSYYDDPLYLEAVGATIESALKIKQWSCPKDEVTILFSAHSLPKKYVEKYGDPYERQINACIRKIMTEQFPNNPWELCYQSKVGNIPWLGPETEGVLHYFAGKNQDNILMVPISFVSDHVETLYEIDQLYIPIAREIGIDHCHRAQALNDHPKFIEALGTMVLKRLEVETISEADRALLSV